MTDPAAGSRPTEQDVREAVRKIVDATYTPAELTQAPPLPAPPHGEPDAGPPTGHPAGVAAGPAAGETGQDRVAVAIGADHGGYALKQAIAAKLTAQGFGVTDCGTTGEDPVDYPDFAHVVARLVASGACRWGIVVDGAGIGSCMAANKVPGVRAAMCYDLSTARNSREHNHANVLTLGARLTGPGLALDIVEAWLATPWGPGRHAARVDKITAIERQYLGDRTGVATR